MEPEPKRIKLTRIDDGNGEKLSTLEKNTNMYNKLLNSYEESLKDLKPALFSSLFAKARKYFENCDTSYTQSSEFRRLLQNPKSLQPLQHLEALFNNFKKNKKISAKKSSTSKNDGETPDTNETGTVSSEVYNKDLFQKFLDIFKERKLSQGSYVDIEKYIVRAWDSFNKCKSSYKKSAAFEELLRRAIDLSAVDPGIQMTVVLDELKFNKKVVRKKQAVGNKVEEAGCSSSTAAEQQPGCSTSTAAAYSTSEENQTQKNETDEDDEDELAGLEPEVRKNVRRLENLLRKVNVKIKHLEEREVDFSKEDDENSAYMKLDRFYRRFDEIFKKICKLKKQKADAGRAVKRNVTFSGGEIEKAVEKHYNKTNQFPDFHDILKITKEVKKKEKLTPNALHSIAQRVFEEFGRLLQRRRIHDVYESACYYLTTSHDPADEDPELRARLEENYEKFKDSEKKVIDMYADKSQGIEPEEVGSSVSNDEAENDDNKNCDDSDDSSDNHSNYPEKQESTVMNYDDDTVIDNEGEGKLQCESAADSNREKACSSKNITSNPGKSSNACTSKDANKLGKSPIASSSKDSKVGEKDHDSSLERRDDGDEIRSKKSSSKCVEIGEKERDSSVESSDELKAAGRDAIETSVKVNDSIEKKESNKLLNTKEGKSLSNSTKNCESVNVEKREEIRDGKIDLSSTKSTTNGCSISGPGDCRSKIADEDSCSLPSKKVENEKTVPVNETIKRSSPSKSVESRIRDDRCSKSESSPSKSESDRKRKFSDENVTRDEHDNKRPKSSEQIVEILPTDDIEVIEVSYCSANRTNKENLKKSNNLNQKTDNVRIQNCDKKTLNSSISDYFPRKNANPMSSDDKSRSNTVQSFNKISAVTSHMRNNGTTRSSNASGAISRSNNSSVTNNLSTNHIRNHKTPAMMLNNSTFSNSSNSSSSPIITSAYSLANRSGDNSSSNTKPSASLPRSQNNNHHQRKDCTSWSQAVTKYRVPRAAVVSSTSTSRSVASSHPIPKDIIDLSDEGDDTSDVSIISEVRTNKPDPGNHDLLKMLDGNTIKYISGEKTKEMLKHGNVKVFSRLKTKQTLNETKSDSVITLD